MSKGPCWDRNPSSAFTGAASLTVVIIVGCAGTTTEHLPGASSLRWTSSAPFTDEGTEAQRGARTNPEPHALWNGAGIHTLVSLSHSHAAFSGRAGEGAEFTGRSIGLGACAHPGSGPLLKARVRPRGVEGEPFPVSMRRSQRWDGMKGPRPHGHRGSRGERGGLRTGAHPRRMGAPPSEPIRSGSQKCTHIEAETNTINKLSQMS